MIKVDRVLQQLTNCLNRDDERLSWQIRFLLQDKLGQLREDLVFHYEFAVLIQGVTLSRGIIREVCQVGYKDAEEDRSFVVKCLICAPQEILRNYLSHV